MHTPVDTQSPLKQLRPSLIGDAQEDRTWVDVDEVVKVVVVVGVIDVGTVDSNVEILFDIVDVVTARQLFPKHTPFIFDAMVQ